MFSKIFYLILCIFLLNNPKAFSSGEGDISPLVNKGSSPNNCEGAVRFLSDSAEIIKTQEPEKHLTTVLTLPIEVLNFSASSREAFESNDISLLVELAVRTEAELLEIPGFEGKNLIEVREVLSKMGLQLGMNVDWLLEQKEGDKPVENLSPGEKSQATTISIESYPILALPIKSSELSVRSYNALSFENVNYVGELIQKTEAELLRMQSLGRKSLAEIKAFLLRLGLQLYMTVVDWPPPFERLKELEEQAKQIYNESPSFPALAYSPGESVVSVVSHPLLALPIGVLDLSPRSSNTLQYNNIKYLGDLAQMTEKELLRNPNFGKRSLAELKEVLSRFRLQLGMMISNWPPDSEQLKMLEEKAFLEFYPTLTSRQEEVLRMRFGIGETSPRSIKEIGRILDLSEGRIREIQMRALQKLYPFARYVFGMGAITSPLDSKYVVEELLKKLDERKKQAPVSPGNAVGIELA